MAVFGRMSFRSKLLLSFVIVILISTALGYVLITIAVNRAFSDFAARSFRDRDATLLHFLGESYARTGSWQGIRQLLARGRPPVPLVLADSEGVIVFAPDAQWVGRTLSKGDLGTGLPIELDGEVVGTIVPPALVLRENSLEQRFLATVSRSLWIAGIIVTAIGILLAFWLLRQLTGPLKQLASASQQIAQGKMEGRVFIRSSDELGHLADSFNKMTTSLEKSEKAKRQMIADVSHELRTPLTVLRTALEGLRDGIIEPKAEKFAALHNKTLLTSRLVEDLHQLASADADHLSIRKAPCDLGQMLSRIQATVGVQLEDSGIRFSIEISPDLPKVQADSQRIEQVVLNLLANAMRYTSEGGTIRMAAQALAEQSVRVSVCNTGHTLSDEELAHMFDRFYRAEPSRPREEGSAGLGLAIAKALIEVHGGRIWAENAPDGCVCVHFTLPRAAKG